jgi:hypothetical protein
LTLAIATHLPDYTALDEVWMPLAVANHMLECASDSQGCADVCFPNATNSGGSGGTSGTAGKAGTGGKPGTGG